ncbi:MAG: DUF1611 domain-containing protein [Pseudomonadota bacterium]
MTALPPHAQPARRASRSPAHGAKWSFATRRANRTDAAGLDRNLAATQPGDLVLAEVTRIGSHKRLQLAEGRYSPLWPGDRIVVACADRYAVDQFDGRARLSEGGADLLAGGGVAGQIVSRNEKLTRGTRLSVLGRLTDQAGVPLNTGRYGLTPAARGCPPLVLAVLGTGMNAGKTAAAAGIVNGFARLGRRVAALKVTGTGSFGDVHEYEAAGAARVLDFTDAGMATTNRQPIERLIAATDLLLVHAGGCDVAVVELADGVSQVETAALLSRPDYVARFDGAILAAPDAMAARGGIAWLGDHGIRPIALSGVLTRAPLAAEEIARATTLPVLCRTTLADPATAAAIETRLTDKDRVAA